MNPQKNILLWAAFVVLWQSCILPLNAKPRAVHLTLNGAVRIALANHVALKVIRNKDRITKQQIAEYWREYLPSLGIEYNRQRDILAGERDNIRHEIKLTVSQLLYDGGKRRMDLDLARLEHLLNRKDFSITLNRIRLSVQTAYIAVVAAREKMALSEDSFKRSVVQYRQAHNRFRQDFLPRQKLMSAAANLRKLELSYLKSENEYMRALSELTSVLNLKHDANIKVNGDLFRDFKLSRPVLNVNKLLARAQAVRPEITRSRINVTRRQMELKIARNAWIPRISLDAYMGRRGEYFPIREQLWGVNFRVSFPLGGNNVNSNGGAGFQNSSGGRRAQSGTGVKIFEDIGYTRRVREGNVAVIEAAAEKQTVHRKVSREILDLYDRLRVGWRAIVIARDMVFYYSENVRLTNVRRSKGEATGADVIFAENERLEAQVELVQSIAGYVEAATELEVKSGLRPGSLKMVIHRPGIGRNLSDAILERRENSLLDKKQNPAGGKLPPGKKKTPLNESDFLINKIPEKRER